MAIRTFQDEPQVEDSLGYSDLANIVSGSAPTTTPEPSPWEPLAQQISQQWQGYGINPEIKGVNRANELAQILSNYGISDLSKLGLKQTPYEEMRGSLTGGGAEGGDYVSELYKGNRGQLTYGDKTFGRLGGFGSGGEKEFATPQEFLTEAGNGRYGLGYSAAGKGWTDYEVVARPDGTPVIVPKWGSSSDVDPEMVQALAIMAMPFTGGLTSALTPSLGAVGAKIATQALISGGLGGLGAAAQGNDFLSGFGKGALTGGITGGLTSFVNPALDRAISSALPESASDLMVSGAKNIAQQAVKSAVLDRPFDLTAALSPVAGEYLQEEFKYDPKTAGALVNLGTKALTGQDLKPSDLLKFANFTAPKESAPKVAEAPQEAGAGYGGADQGYFDEAQEVIGLPSWAVDPYAEETQTIPVTAQREVPEGLFPEFEQPLLTTDDTQRYEITQKLPTPLLPEDLFPEFEQPLLTTDDTQRYEVTGKQPQPLFPEDLFPEFEAPLMEEPRYFTAEEGKPQTIDVTGKKYEPPIIPLEDVPEVKYPDILPREPIYEQPPTPAPSPAPAPLPASPAPTPPPAPGPSPAPAPAAQSPDLSSLLSLLGRGQGAQTTYNPVLFQGPAIDLDKLFGYREPSSLDELLAMIGQRPRG